MGRLAVEVRETAIEMLSAGFRPAAVARELGIHRNTLSNWIRKDREFRDRLLDKRFERARAVLDHRKNVEQMAFDLNQPGHVRLRASLEVLKALDPITWDPACRRRHAEAEEPETFNTRVQYQEYLDKRDARIQAENAAKAMAAKVEEEEDPKGQLSLQLFIDDLRKIQHEAGKEAAKQADNYEADKPNGVTTAIPG